MKKSLLAIVVFMGTTIISACSSHFYPSSNENVSKTEVILSQKNFKVIGQATGSATTKKVLGIGGLSKKAIQGNAVAQMFENAHLSGAQTVININIKSSGVGFLPFYLQTTYIATGTIIEFVSESEVPTITATGDNKQSSQNTQTEAKKDNAVVDAKVLPKESSKSKNDKKDIVIPNIIYSVGDEIECDGLKVKIIGIDKNQALLAFDSNNASSWDEAIKYCKSLTGDWRLPTSKELKTNHKNIKQQFYWTCENLDEQRALYYDYEYNRCYNTSKNRHFYILPVKSVNINELK